MIFIFFILTASSFAMESGYHENSPLLMNGPEQLEIVVETEAKDNTHILPLKLLCAKKIMQSYDAYKKDLKRLPAEAHDLLNIYQPLTTKNMFTTFKQAQQLEDKTRKVECANFIIENKAQDLIHFCNFKAIDEKHVFLGINQMESAIRDELKIKINAPQELLNDVDFNDAIESIPLRGAVRKLSCWYICKGISVICILCGAMSTMIGVPLLIDLT